MPLKKKNNQDPNTLAEESIPPLPRRPRLPLKPLLLENPGQIELARTSRDIDRRRALNGRALPDLEHDVAENDHGRREVRLEEVQHLLADGHVLVAHGPCADPKLGHEH